MAYYCPHIWPMYARIYGPFLPLYLAHSCPHMRACMAYHAVAKIISKVGLRAAAEPPLKHIYSSA